ncbi:hypothetical protein ILYODFUR_027369 [Ilyodon furcidens]|uniref:Uncharacterized protein n=1 Tax=Ilyodon furcidens TaxID=33524 RepID=A0ABV0U8W3_9TELE
MIRTPLGNSKTNFKHLPGVPVFSSDFPSKASPQKDSWTTNLPFGSTQPVKIWEVKVVGTECIDGRKCSGVEPSNRPKTTDDTAEATRWTSL